MSTPKHLFGVATLVAPTGLAWSVACSAFHRDEVTLLVSATLGPLWGAVVAIIVLRGMVLVALRSRDVLADLAVLTRGGVALGWMSALAVLSAMWLG